MGIFSRIKAALQLSEAAAQTPGPRFSVDIDPAVFGLSAYEDETIPLPRVSRSAAMQVPGVKRGRDLICAPIGGLRIGVLNAQLGDVTNGFLQQPERDVPRGVTYTRLAEDLLFEGRAWWRITEQDYRGFPLRVQRKPRSHVDPRGPGDVWMLDDSDPQRPVWEHVPDKQIIRFDSPTDGVLIAGAGAIRTVLMLDRRAYRSAANPVPDGYFTPYGDIDPFDDDDPTLTDEERADLNSARNWLRAWAAQRLESSQGYVPAGLKYEQLSWDPKQLQLAEARQHAILEVVRLLGLEPEDLGVPVTSRTYFNAETKRRDRIDFTLGMYIDAIQDRLSMGDVTPRGQLVRFNINDFVRSDTLARYQAYQLGLQVGAIADYQEVRELEGGAPLTSKQLARLDSATQPAQEGTTVPDNVRQLNPAATRPTGTTFAADDMLTMTTQVDQRFKVDLSSRTISGLAVPYGGARAFHDGQQFEFSKGTIRVPADPSRVKLFVNHDSNRAVGYATQLEDTDDGLHATFKVVESPAGDEALLYADQKVWDGLSAGFRQGSKFRAKDGVQFAVDAPLGEISVCPSPAFDDARVSAVALSADNEGKNPMTDTTVTPATPEATPAQQPAQSVQFADQQNQQAPQFAAQVTDAINAGFQALAQQMLSQPQREFVPANGAGGAQFQVNEELPYRFDGSTRGEHCFTDDLRDMQNGNQQAKQRLEQFMNDWAATFAVTTGNVSALNPTQNRPELYVPNLQFTRPLWDNVSTGTIDNQSPFNVPKFGAASGLVGPHTQGVEPTPGAFSATVQTVQPTPVSGKVEINREVWDLGGNPQTDTIVWNEMQNAYFEGIETNIATMLNALAAATLYSGAEINLAGAVDSALDAALSDLMTDLQFVRGGNRYTQWVSDAQLFKALTRAKDTTNRKLYPQMGPTNAAGQAAPLNRSVNVNGQDVNPAWALSNGIAANTQNSYAFVKSSVWAWASAPKRFTFEYQVKSIDMAVWGYTGSAVLRNTDVIRIDYTTADV